MWAGHQEEGCKNDPNQLYRLPVILVNAQAM